MAVKPIMKCKNCGNTTFTREYHTASGDLACNSCGAVMEENPIVSEVTFAENAAGAATVQGSYVANDQAHVNFGNGRGSLESREQTLQSGKRRIKNVALALNIPDFVADSAYQWFQLALTNNFVQGRRSQNVIAACLYVACRREKTHHMLIDFSSRLQVSVYAIGATFLKMVKALHITNLPLVDPSLFIQHYADKLDFGKSKLKVISDATKLAHRMGDDWIHEGRRPAGVAGACLLLAARMNNFRRTHTEIMAVTHIGTQTIQKRLKEFKETKSAQMSVSEFRDGNNVEPSLPPAFKKNLKENRKRKRDIEDVGRIEEEMAADPVLGAMLEDSEITEEEIQHHIKMLLKRREDDVKRKVNKRIVKDSKGETKVIIDFDDDDDDDDDDKDLQTSTGNNDHFGNDKRSLNEFEAKLERMIDENRPRNLVLALPSTKEILERVPDDPDNLEDADDEEIESCLLSKEESSQKERLWVGSNQDYLIQQEQKRLKIEADKIAGHTTTIRKRRKAKIEEDDEDVRRAVKGFTNLGDVMKATLEGHGSASENAKTLLSSKSLSKKINYNAVNNLFDD